MADDGTRAHSRDHDHVDPVVRLERGESVAETHGEEWVGTRQSVKRSAGSPFGGDAGPGPTLVEQ